MMAQYIFNYIFGLLLFNQLYEIEPVVVTATRYPKNILEITRAVTIIDSTEISRYSSIAEALKYIAGMDMKIRGDNIQADPSIRGSTFQQVLVMIDGVRVNDPQTGHHNLNIPVPLSEIERIEILHGSASSLYGSDACGGVINIITKKSAGIAGGFGLGSFGYKDYFGKLATNEVSIDFAAKSSDGHEPGYEYSQYNLGAKFNANIANSYKCTLFSGFLNKTFGAKNFYAPYPSWEANRTFVASLNNYWFVLPWFMLNPVLSFRTHIDTFVLDVENPSFYANRHQSYTYGLQIMAHLNFKNLGYLITGLEIFRDSLNSTRLGERRRQRISLFGQIEKKLLKERMILSAGLRNDYYYNIKNSVNPHISLAYKLLPLLKLNFSAGSSFRVPTFTELYYQDPANKGDSLLKSESAYEYEMGINYFRKNTSASATFYVRNTMDNIDWVKKADDVVWQVDNIGYNKFYGIEFSLNLNFWGWFSWKNTASYIMLIKQLPEGYLSKYALQVPKIMLSDQLEFFNIAYVTLTWTSFTENDNRFIVNAFFNKEFTIQNKAKLKLASGITNFFDKRYEDFKDVPLPGRALRINVSIGSGG